MGDGPLHRLDPAEVKNGPILEDQIMPYLHKRHEDWQGLDRDIQWKGSTAHKHLHDHLKNLLRKKG